MTFARWVKHLANNHLFGLHGRVGGGGGFSLVVNARFKAWLHRLLVEHGWDFTFFPCIIKSITVYFQEWRQGKYYSILGALLVHLIGDGWPNRETVEISTHEPPLNRVWSHRLAHQNYILCPTLPSPSVFHQSNSKLRKHCFSVCSTVFT